MIRFRIMFLVIFFIPLFLSAQFKRDQETEDMVHETSGSQKFYQSLFNTKQSEFGKTLSPGFDVDKEALTRQLREGVLLNGPVNPDEYTVGPGDVLQINILGKIASSIPVSINTEGNIDIPNSGTIEANGLTLTSLKEKLSEKLGEMFLNSQISVSLVSPRLFGVYVGGIVDNPGNYYASAVHRVDQVIYMANLSVTAEAELAKELRTKDEFVQMPDAWEYFNTYNPGNDKQKMSFRNIKVIRSSGDTLHADLMLFYATGNLKYNPTLNDGDRVIVPSELRENNTVTISGAVNLNGEYEHTKHDSLSTLLEIGLGFSADADPTKINYYTFDQDNGKFQSKVINYNDIKSGALNDFALNAGDRIVVSKKRQKYIISNVTVRGEVVNPGKYPVVKGKTKLSEILEYCGGFTENASLREAKVYRSGFGILDPAESNPDYVRLTQMRKMVMDRNERRNFNLDAVLKRDFVSVDFAKLIETNSDEYDIILEPGDIVLVPPVNNHVNVNGQVRFAGFIEYEKGLDAYDYIELAGGLTEVARTNEIAVIKAGSNEWVDPEEAIVEPGDTIYIPKELDHDFNWYFNWFSRIVTTVGGAATIYLLLQK